MPFREIDVRTLNDRNVSKGGNFLACRTFYFYYCSLVICFSVTVFGESGISITPHIWTTNIYRVSWLPPEKKKRSFKNVGWEHSIKEETLMVMLEQESECHFLQKSIVCWWDEERGFEDSLFVTCVTGYWQETRQGGGRELTAWERELLVRWSYRNISSTSHLNHI